MGARHDDLSMLLLNPRMLRLSRRAVVLPAALILVLAWLIGAAPSIAAAASANRVRLVILMVWDGLRPDAVTARGTPNLYAMTHQGVFFSAHHSIYPSLTMVNGAALATGALPGANGIVANTMYFAHLLGADAGSNNALERVRRSPVSLESSATLAALDAPVALDGNVVAVETVAQRLLREGGFVGIVGKSGPTFLFDDQVGAPGHDAAAGEIFISDDRVFPQSLVEQAGLGLSLASIKAALGRTPPFGEQDEHLTQAFIDQVLPAAAAALAANHSALLVLWQHNPDATEHAAGLGTAAVDRALAICDANLGRLRAALARLHLDDRTDLLVVSDHGFATVKMRVDFVSLLIAQGLKQSRSSDDVIVAHNFGSDAIYLSPRLEPAARAALMRRIVDYAAAQEWCGPIFSRALNARAERGYAGEIPGTFDQAWFGLLNPKRSADLVISFRELAGEDNSALTGPHATALALGPGGVRVEPNHSQPLLHPMMGVAYADSGPAFTTGNGSHGSLGEYEMHNFGAAIGPDFRRGYVDRAPSSSVDIAHTIAALLHLSNRAAPPAESGRVLKEALSNASQPPPYRRVPLSVALDLPAQRIVTTIYVDQTGEQRYPAAATVTHIAVPAHQTAAEKTR